MTLWSDFLTNTGKVADKWKHYFPVYERHFGGFVNRPVTVLEIGVQRGGSLQMWKRYFGPHARIIGVDIDPSCKAHEEDQIEIRIGAQQDEVFLKAVDDEFGRFDIVLDDGGHIMSHISTSFRFLYPRMAASGVYLVEDLHTAYWPEYEGGLHRKSTFIEQAKDLIDELNADHSRGERPATEFTTTTLSMHFYDSVVVFERGRHTAKMPLRTGVG
jgi:hypothetical protein